MENDTTQVQNPFLAVKEVLEQTPIDIDGGTFRKVWEKTRPFIEATLGALEDRLREEEQLIESIEEEENKIVIVTRSLGIWPVELKPKPLAGAASSTAAWFNRWAIDFAKGKRLHQGLRAVVMIGGEHLPSAHRQSIVWGLHFFGKREYVDKYYSLFKELESETGGRALRGERTGGNSASAFLVHLLQASEISGELSATEKLSQIAKDMVYLIRYVREHWDRFPKFYSQEELSGASIEYQPTTQTELPDDQEVIMDFTRWVKEKGFTFDNDQIKEFTSALHAKPFVILSGISGTGKTQLARLWAVWDVLGLENNEEKRAKPLGELFKEAQQTGRYAFVPVRPDWTDAKGALGFYNQLHSRYEATDLLRVLLNAEKDEEKRPHYLILDEMNLARVEYYFSDFLSAMESRDEPIPLHSQTEAKAADGTLIPPSIKLPAHVRISGTVNVDETTYAFAPKVLDRAFVLEFTEVDYDGYLSQRDDVPEGFEEFVKAVANILRLVNLHFGYRVLSEMLDFLKANGDVNDNALDFLLLSKVLPKIRGEGAELEPVLEKLQTFCNPKYPRASAKVERMLNDAKTKGFVSYLV